MPSICLVYKMASLNSLSLNANLSNTSLSANQQSLKQQQPHQHYLFVSIASIAIPSRKFSNVEEDFYEWQRCIPRHGNGRPGPCGVVWQENNQVQVKG